ncbi:MAG: hypothetical protein HQL95_03585, partial [Magnetococcales bacterium]|nr:hypothetical protein [Magnetococcales bacterium]
MRQLGFQFKNSGTLLALAGAVALVVGTAACGGGGGSSSSSTSTTGNAVDGYLIGCTVRSDDGKTTVTVAPKGSYTFTPAVTGKVTLVGGGTCVDKGADGNGNTAFNGVLTAPASSTGSGVISPLSTMVQNIIDKNPGMTVATANSQVITALQNQLGVTVTAGTDLSSYDPLATYNSSTTNTLAKQLLNVSQTIGTLVSSQSAVTSIESLKTTLTNNGVADITTTILNAAPTTLVANTVSTIATSSAKSGAFIVQPTITLTDYVSSVATPQTIAQTVASGTLTANVATALNATNLSNVGKGTGTAPTINFTLAALPGTTAAPVNGTAAVSALLVDGADLTRTAGERYLMAETTYNGSSDGTTLTLTAPAGG